MPTVTATTTDKGRVAEASRPRERILTGEEQLMRARGERDTYARTNIVVNDDLIEEARQLTGLQSKKDVVEEALRTFVQMKSQARLRELRGIGWEGNLQEMRRAREFVEQGWEE